MGLFDKLKSKKDKDRGDLSESNRPSPSPANGNPYAQKNDSEQDAYTSKPSGGYGNMGAPPPSYDASNSLDPQRPSGRMNGFNQQQRNEKSPVPVGGYGGGNTNGSNDRLGGKSGYGGGRYGGAGTYGEQNGYGSSNPYGSTTSSSRPRPGGYGGMGDVDEDSSRYGRPGKPDSTYTRPGAAVEDRNNLYGSSQSPLEQKESYYGPNDNGQYGNGLTEELSEEQQEEREVQRITNEANGIRYESNASLQRTTQTMDNALESIQRTRERLMQQNDSLDRTYQNVQRTEKQLDIAKSNLTTFDRVGMFNNGRMSEREAKKKEEAYKNDILASRSIRDRDLAEQHEYDQANRQYEQRLADHSRKLRSKYDFKDEGDDEPVPDHLVMAEDEVGQRLQKEQNHYLKQLYGKATEMKLAVENTGDLISYGDKRAQKISSVTDDNQATLEMHQRKLDRIAKK